MGTGLETLTICCRSHPYTTCERGGRIIIANTTCSVARPWPLRHPFAHATKAPYPKHPILSTRHVGRVLFDITYATLHIRRVAFHTTRAQPQKNKRGLPPHTAVPYRSHDAFVAGSAFGAESAHTDFCLSQPGMTHTNTAEGHG